MDNLSRLATQFSGPGGPEAVKGRGESFFKAVDGFWGAVYQSPHLTLRMKELVMLALHASSSSLNGDAIKRHTQRAIAAGASETDVIDVLVTIIPLANHPLYIGIPILMDELEKAGHGDQTQMPDMRSDILAIKEDFVRSRGYWTAMRDTIGSWMPEYFASFINACMEPWRSGSLTPAERELMYIAIDCSITHTYEPGMRMHIQNALRYGATRDQIMEVFQLSALLGTEGYVLGLKAMTDPD